MLLLRWHLYIQTRHITSAPVIQGHSELFFFFYIESTYVGFNQEVWPYKNA